MAASQPNTPNAVRPPAKTKDSAESQLDTLFAVQESKQTEPGAADRSEGSRMDQLRRQFVTDLIPSFDALRTKYAEKGVLLELDADNFVNGGRNLSITVEYEGTGSRLDGVVTSVAIAFTETRFSAGDRGGVAASGPSLRIHDLTADTFRDFVCRQIAPLVQSVLRRRR